MKKDMLTRIILIYVILTVLSIALIEIFITEAVRERREEDLKKSLVVQLGLLEDIVPFGQGKIDDLCKRLKETTGARITVIRADGMVIGDSDTDSSQMENHAGRSEIVEALLSATGISVRLSETTRHDYLYIARRITRDGDVQGFIRMAVPLEEIDRAVNDLRFMLIVIVSIVLLSTGILSILQIERLRKLIGEMRGFSQSLARGDFSGKLFLKGGREFEEIARNFNTMTEKLKSVMSEKEEEKNRLGLILKSVPDALLITDARGTVLLSSASSSEYFGNTDPAGKQFLELVRSHDFADLVDHVRTTLSPASVQLKLDLPDERYLVAKVSPLFYRDRDLAGFVAVLHDITQMKKLEEIRKDFVANVSHELKTPITAIRGFAETLLEGAIDDREHALRFAGMIKANSERINSLIDDLMTISRIELGVIKVDKAEIDIIDVADTVLALLRNKAAEKGLAVGTSFPEGTGTIQADRNRLIQILTNLVDNAIKFTEKGEITLGAEEEAGRFVLFVRDTGIGVQQKHLPRLGERFYRVDPARSRTMGGTGLGLAIVKHLVRAHGWEMRIESTFGQGTKVKIYLPVA
ncbi:MAG TPA: ATP-binding protein [Dissulfurispiraceae bacterium]|nr:ATP-binding protein [Dissulfurispiraceae bacterium]